MLAPGGILSAGHPLYDELAQGFARLANGETPDACLTAAHPAANIFPMLAEHRRESFRASLDEKQNRPIVLHRDKVLDGRNRARELITLGKPIDFVVFTGNLREATKFVIAENLERRDLTDAERAWIAGELGKFNLGANQHSRKEGPPIGGGSLDLGDTPAAPETPMTTAERAELMNVSVRQVERADAVKAKGAEELQAAVKSGQVALSTAEDLAKLPAEQQREIVKLSDKEILEAAKKIRKEQNDKRRAERMGRLAQQAAGNSELPTARKFPVIYMDPPSKFSAGDSDRSTENHYPTMTEEDIAKLPVSDLATDDAVLFIWTTVPWLRKTMNLIETWGFAYVSEFVWDKRIAGTGFWNRNRHESLLIATRGKMPAPDPEALEPSLYPEERGAHSRKPEYFRDLIARYYPDLPKVEMFARGKLPENWFGWGNEAQPDAQQSLLPEAAE